MKKSIIRLLGIFMVSILFTGCKDDNGQEDYAYFDQFMVYVKFVSPTDTNVVDSLAFLKNTEYQEPFDPETDGVIKVSCVRDSDGKKLQFWEPYWTHFFLIERDLGHDNDLKDGTLMRLFWSDNWISSPENAPSETYDQSYTISFRSKEIFGEEEPHTIKWYVHVNKNRFNTYKIEIDGEDYPYKETPRFQHNMPLVVLLQVTLGK